MEVREMDVNAQKDGDKVEAVLSGSLDTKGAEVLQNAMNGIFEEGYGVKVVMDFSSVSFVSSAGLRVLLLTMKKVNSAGGSLELRNVSDSIKEVLNMTGFSFILKVL
jgi:anti-anti-sigma factor